MTITEGVLPVVEAAIGFAFIFFVETAKYLSGIEGLTSKVSVVCVDSNICNEPAAVGWKSMVSSDKLEDSELKFGTVELFDNSKFRNRKHFLLIPSGFPNIKHFCSCLG